MKARLHHVQLTLPAGAEDVARAFYAGVLGMQEMEKPAALVARGGCWFRAGLLELHLGVAEPFVPSHKGHPGIQVEGLGAVGRDIIQAGIPVEWDDTFPGHRRFYVFDPFGNRLEFLEPVVNVATVRYEALTPDGLESWRPQAVTAYADSFADPPYARSKAEAARFRDALTAHTARTGFVAIGAWIDETLAGFTYGYSIGPNQGWHDQVRPALGEQADVWLNDAFEYVELAVRPEFRRLGIGRALHDRLLAAQRHRAAVLSTLDRLTAGRRLYESAGWIPLLRNFRFARTTTRYMIMGLDLRGHATEGA